jgi:hypothetical protein
MSTATEVSTKERLEAKRAALLNRREELRDLLNDSPSTIAIARETWFRSEATADEKKLHAAKKRQSLAASELTELEENLATVDRLLGEELVKEREAERGRLTARLGELRDEQVEAFKTCADIFADLHAAWQEFAATEEALQSAWFVSPHREGVQAQHLLDPTPVRYEAMLGVLFRAALSVRTLGTRRLSASRTWSLTLARIHRSSSGSGNPGLEDLLMSGPEYWGAQYVKLQKQKARSQPKQKAEPPKMETHPLLLRHDNVHHELEAQRTVAGQQAQARREWEMRQGPHPLVVGPLSHIPIPERKQQRKRK